MSTNKEEIQKLKAELELIKESSNNTKLVSANDQAINGLKCYEKGKHSAAMSHLMKSLSELKDIQSVKNGSISTAMVLESLSRILVDSERYKEAAKYCKLALEIKRQTLPIHPSYIGSTLRFLSHIYQNQKKYERAIEYLNQELEIKIRNSLSGINNSTVACQFTQIGLVYSNQEKYDEAVMCYRQALEIFKALRDCDNVPVVLDSIATFRSKQGKYEEALECLKEALDIRARSRNHDIGENVSRLIDTADRIGKSREIRDYIFCNYLMIL